MKNVLFVTSSPRGVESHSHQIARAIVDDLKIGNVAAQVVVRDLAKQPLPHPGDAFARGRALPTDKRDQEALRALALSDTLIDEVNSADVIVIAAPMHNFGIPSSLKAWIDHIVRPGRTFSYSEKGPKGLLEGKRVVLVLARGGIYSSGPMQKFDFQEPYLRAVLGFMGITDVDVVYVEGVGMGEAAVRNAVASAKAQAAAVVQSIGAGLANAPVRIAA